MGINKLSVMVYSHYTGTVLGPMQDEMKSMAPCENIHTVMRQGPGPLFAIVPVLFPVPASFLCSVNKSFNRVYI